MTDSYSFAQAFAIERLRSTRKPSETNAIMTIRGLIEDHRVDIDVACNVVFVTFGMGINQQDEIRKEAHRRYSKVSA